MQKPRKHLRVFDGIVRRDSAAKVEGEAFDPLKSWTEDAPAIYPWPTLTYDAKKGMVQKLATIRAGACAQSPCLFRCNNCGLLGD